MSALNYVLRYVKPRLPETYISPPPGRRSCLSLWPTRACRMPFPCVTFGSVLCSGHYRVSYMPESLQALWQGVTDLSPCTLEAFCQVTKRFLKAFKPYKRMQFCSNLCVKRLKGKGFTVCCMSPLALAGSQRRGCRWHGRRLREAARGAVRCNRPRQSIENRAMPCQRQRRGKNNA